MKLSQLVFKSMLKNMKYYYLYFFALIFSVTLFFSFVTLQNNPSIIEATTKSGTASAGFEAASYMLYFIVLFFVLYANHLFVKRRSKEIGLYQLIGMTKGLVIRLIAFENILLFVISVVIGMLTGLLSSRLFAMILLKILRFEAVVTMSFSKVAIVNTCLVFSVLLVIILVQMAFMVRRTTLLSLFTASKQADERVKRFSWFPMLMGAVGLLLIAYGYYKSTILFSIEAGGNLFVNMVVILATTIGGTYFVFRYSVSFIMNLLRMRKKGHLNLIDVLAVTPIMHRMKGNSKSLTLITVLTAVSLAITTLSYISYFSANESAATEVPADYITVDGRETAFLERLDAAGISYTTEQVEMTAANVDLAEFLPNELVEQFAGNTKTSMLLIPLSDYQSFYPNLTLVDDEAVMTSYNGFMAKFMPIEPGFNMSLMHGEQVVNLHVKDIHEDAVLTWRLTGNASILVVSDTLFEQFKAYNAAEPIDQLASRQTAIFLTDEKDLVLAEEHYIKSGANRLSDEADSLKFSSRYAAEQYNLNMYGTTIFTTAFLGLAFLLATGSILYFKQMSEADEEIGSYMILRKIGFSEQDILRGIVFKQLFSFGVPLFIGLLHSYFAVKSGWFLFGSELVTPLLVTMALYIMMYAVFALLTINYYKKVIKQAL